MVIAPVVAVPLNSRTEADAVAIAKVPLVTVPVRLRVPPEAVIELLFEIGMPIVPEPVTAVVAEIVPLPLIVPPAIVMPAVSVSWVVPAPSSFTVLAPTANAVPTVNVPLVLSSSVPLEEKVTAWAALAASSNSLSVAPVMVNTRALPLSAIAPVISSVPPFAVMCAAPLVVTAAATLPSPVIVPVLIVTPVSASRVVPAPSSWTVPVPTASAVPTVNVPLVLSSSVPLEEKVTAWAALAASSNSLSVAPVMVNTRALPLSAIAPVISSVPPFAVMCAAPLVVTAAATLPRPVIVPVLIVSPFASVRVEEAPSSLTVPVPIAIAVPTVKLPLVLSSSVPLEEKVTI